MRKMNDGQPGRGAHSKAGVADGGDAAVLSALARAALAQQKSASPQEGADQGQSAQPGAAQSDAFDTGTSFAQPAAQPAQPAQPAQSAQPAQQPAAQQPAAQQPAAQQPAAQQSAAQQPEFDQVQPYVTPMTQQQPQPWQPASYAAPVQADGFAQPEPGTAFAAQPFGLGEPQAYAEPVPRYETQPQAQLADFAQPQSQPYAAPVPQPAVQPISQPVLTEQAQEGDFSASAAYTPKPVPQAQDRTDGGASTAPFSVEPASDFPAFAAGAHAASAGERDAAASGDAGADGFAATAGAHSAGAASAASAASVASTPAAATGAHSAGADGKSAAFAGEKGAHTAGAGVKGKTPAAGEKEKSPEKGAHAATGAKKKKRAPLIIALVVVCVAAIAGAVWFFASHSVPDTEAVKVVEKALDSAKSTSASTVAQLVEKDAGESLSRYGIDTASLASWLQKDMSCKVTKLEEQDSTATVTVKATCHDLPQFQECITAVAKEAATSTDFQNITTADDAYKLIGTKAFERAKSESPASKSFEVKLVKKGDTWELANKDESAILSQLWE